MKPLFVMQALAAANQYIVTNLSKTGRAAHKAPALDGRHWTLTSPFAKAAAAAAMQQGGAAKDEPPAQDGEHAAAGLQAARSGSGAGATGSTSPPRDEQPVGSKSDARDAVTGSGNAPLAPPVAAASGRSLNTAEVCCSLVFVTYKGMSTVSRCSRQWRFD